MKQVWTADEIGESWTLSHDEFVLVENRRRAGNRLGFALQLKHYQLYARFLDGFREVPGDVTEYLVEQLEDGSAKLDAYDWGGRSGRRHRREILQFLCVRKPVRVKSGIFTNQVGTIVRVDRRNPDTFNDGLTYWIELARNFRVACKSGEFDSVI